MSETPEEKDNGIYYDVAPIMYPSPLGMGNWEVDFQVDADLYALSTVSSTHRGAWNSILAQMRELRDELQKEIDKIEAEMAEDEAEQSHFAHDEDGNLVLDENGAPVVVTDALKWGTDPDPEA